MLIYIIFAFLLLFVLAYYFAFEYSRYKTARTMAEGLDGEAVFRIGRSYMRRSHDGVEERAWVVPDDKMAWGSILSVLKPPMAILFLERDGGDPGFRFHIEPKTGILLRTISLDALKEADFSVPQLDENLRLRTDNPGEAKAYFSAPQRQQALIDLFLAGFTRLRDDHGVTAAMMKGVSTDSTGAGVIENSILDTWEGFDAPAAGHEVRPSAGCRFWGTLSEAALSNH